VSGEGYVSPGHNSAFYDEENGKYYLIQLTKSGKIKGAVKGKWKLIDDHTAELTIDGSTYKGVFLKEWNEATASNGVPISPEND